MKPEFIAICDDNIKICDSLKKNISDLYPEFAELIFSFYDFESFSSFINTKKNTCGIILMDIVLGETNGIEQVKNLQIVNSLWKFIFITGYTKHLSDIFTANPDGLLYKPIDKSHLKQSIDIVISQIKKIEPTNISLNLIKSGKILVDSSKIIYIESDKRIIHVHMLNNEIHSSYMKLNNLLSVLPVIFVICHKSYVINSSMIKGMSSNSLTMIDGTIIPISRSHKQAIRKLFFENLQSEI